MFEQRVWIWEGEMMIIRTILLLVLGTSLIACNGGERSKKVSVECSIAPTVQQLSMMAEESTDWIDGTLGARPSHLGGVLAPAPERVGGRQLSKAIQGRLGNMPFDINGDGEPELIRVHLPLEAQSPYLSWSDQVRCHLVWIEGVQVWHVSSLCSAEVGGSVRVISQTAYEAQSCLDCVGDTCTACDSELTSDAVSCVKEGAGAFYADAGVEVDAGPAAREIDPTSGDSQIQLTLTGGLEPAFDGEVAFFRASAHGEPVGQENGGENGYIIRTVGKSDGSVTFRLSFMDLLSEPYTYFGEESVLTFQQDGVVYSSNPSGESRVDVTEVRGEGAIIISGTIEGMMMPDEAPEGPPLRVEGVFQATMDPL